MTRPSPRAHSSVVLDGLARAAEAGANAAETVVGCQGMDGLVALGGCHKNMPGCLIAIARLDRPAVFVYGGTIRPGSLEGSERPIDIASVFEAVGATPPAATTTRGVLAKHAHTVTSASLGAVTDHELKP